METDEEKAFLMRTVVKVLYCEEEEDIEDTCELLGSMLKDARINLLEDVTQ